MLRSMFSAVSGLRSHQTMMDVTGNNIANVNTPGYKAQRTTFQETLTQLIRGGAAGQLGPGGAGWQNPMQIGLGVQVASTDMIDTQGASQLTGRLTDVAIQGTGFFVVEAAGGAQFYMRAGAFSFDSDGQLVSPNGERVLSLVDGAPGAPIRVDFDDYTDVGINQLGEVVGLAQDGSAEIIAQMVLARFPSHGGLQRAGNGLFAESVASGPPIYGAPGGMEGHGRLQAGTLEMSNVDLAAEFTGLILAQRGFQANARTITTSDELLQELVNLKR